MIGTNTSRPQKYYVDGGHVANNLQAYTLVRETTCHAPTKSGLPFPPHNTLP